MESTREIKPDMAQSGSVEQNSYTYHKFELTEKNKIVTFTLVPGNSESDLDLYISRIFQAVTRENCTWRKFAVGTIILRISPNDKNYSLGWYYIGICGSKPGTNTFTLSISLSDPVEVTNVSNKVPLRYTIKSKSAAYFQFTIETKSDTALIHIWTNVGSNLVAFYVSTNALYPSADDCEWTTKKDDALKVYWSDYSPFVLNSKGMLEYASERESWVEPSTRNDHAALFVDGNNWKHTIKVCHIGISNLSDFSITGYLIVSEQQEFDLLPPLVQRQCQTFSEVFKNTKGGSISQEERNAKELHGAEFTYGEIELVHFISLLKIAHPEKGGVFWDLGSGTGKALIAAALARNDFVRICGVEQLEGLHTACLQAINDYCVTTHTDKGRFKVLKGDMRSVDWSDADVVYASSICFPEELIKELGEKGKVLKKKTIIVSLKPWVPQDTYRLLKSMQVKMTWGKAGIYVLEKT